MTTPNQVRAGLTLITSAAVADTQAVAALGGTPRDIRASLFEAVPLIVGDYIDGSGALALDWYDELRDNAAPSKKFTPRLVTNVNSDDLAASVAVATRPLYELENGSTPLTEALLRQATSQSLDVLTLDVQKSVATGYWDTITTNSDQDPSAAGWQRFARGAACKFCQMLAGRGAVYTRTSVNFAAHGGCHCVSGPSFDPNAPRASAMQYVASKKTRTPEQQAALRDYLNQHYPDAPG